MEKLLILWWKTAFRTQVARYHRGMVKAPTEADLNRLRQFLEKLESDARTAVDHSDVDRREIEMLKDEIAYLEDVRSKAFLFQIEINYGASRAA
jgi:hypothetical protein